MTRPEAFHYRVTRLGPGDRARALRLFRLMTEVFEEGARSELGDAYVDQLLGRAELWILAATSGDVVVGGLTAHTLPLTRAESAELFIYDIAVHPAHQRRGVGRQLMQHLLSEARVSGMPDLFVAADNEDLHALEFYRALGGRASPVTHFDFTA